MKNVPVTVVCLALSLALAAPSADAQKKKKKPAPPAAAAVSPIEPTLTDLERVSAATQSDLADLKSEKHSSFNWKTAWRFWHRESSHSQKTLEIAESVQRNLHDAMPGLVQDVRATSSFSSTFKLYNDVTVVCGMLDSLVDSTKAEGKKGDGPLANDSVAMGRIRQDLATFIEQKAAALDANGTPPYTWTSVSTPNGIVRKIVVDDNVPAKKPGAKRTVAAQQ